MDFRRIISLFLALTMIISIFTGIIPVNVFASETADSAEIVDNSEESANGVIARYEVPLDEVTVDENGNMYLNLSDYEPEATEASEPEATEPEATEPEATEPKATEPEATEASEPEATEPEATEPEATEASEPEATEPEATEPEITEPLTWFQWIEEKGVDVSALTKEECQDLSAEYSAYRVNTLAEMGVLPEGAAEGMVSNKYIEVAVDSEGRFTIGNRIGNPNYSSDDNQILLFGHPNPGTSETLIYIDGSYQNYFYADTTTYSYNTAVSTMNVPSYGIKVVQTLKLTKVEGSSFENTVQIQYQVYNNDSAKHSVGVRIMMDTMLAYNDDATYRLASLGHVTTARVFTGSAIPSTYQFYDNIENPTTVATGYLYRDGDRKPDKVQFCNWGGIRGSGWNHHVNDNDYLGDSAIGIYFNPTDIKPGKNFTVRTYYGVNVGTATGDSTEVGSSEVKLTVKDSYSNEPLEGVSVTYKLGLDTAVYSTTTNSSGVATLTGFSNSKDIVSTMITLAKEGYKTTSYRTNLRGGSNVTQQMSVEDAPKPVINSITLTTGNSTVNLLNSTYTFDEDPNDFISKNGATGTVTIKATSDMENCTWYLVQNAKVIQRNSTGEFTFNVRKTTMNDEERILIEDLTPNGTRYIYCVSPDGERSEQMRFGLKVRAGTEVKFGDFDLSKVWPSVHGSIAEGTLGALFLGNKLTFGPSGGKYKVFAELTEEGKVRVGLNVDLKELGKFNEIEDGKPVYKDRKEDYLESLRQEMMDFCSGKNTKMKGTVNKPGSFRYGIGEADFVFCGYGEGFLENGSVRVDVTVYFAVKATGSNTWQFIAWSIPVYVQVGGEVGAKLQASANIVNTEGLGFRFYEAKFNPSIKLWLEGGVGVKKVASLGVQGSGTLDVNWDLMNQSLIISLKAAASLVAEAFGIFEKDLTFAQKTVPIYDSNDKEGTVYGGDENLFELLKEQPYRLITREENAEGGTSQYATNARIVTVGGAQYKFFATDRGGDLSNRYMLCWSKLENGSWTAPTPVADDGTSDLYYDVAVSGSDIYVVWSNSNRVFNDATVTLDEFAAAQEICLSVMDTTTGTSGQPIRLTNNSIMDSQPAVTVLSGTAYVAWSHTANSMEDMTDIYDNYLHYTAVVGGTPGEIVSVNFGKASINTVNASSASGKPLATIVSNDSDEDALKENDTTVVDMSNGTKTDMDTTNNTIGKTVSGIIDGVEQVFWMENGNVAYADSITSENPTYIFSEETIPGSITVDNYTVITMGESTYLIWSQSSGEENAPATAMTTVYSNGTWSGVHKLTELSTGNITELDGYMNSEGQLVLVYTVKTISKNVDGNHSMITYSTEKIVEPEQSVRIASLNFKITDAIPGQIMPMKLDVVNTGNTVIDSLDISINSEAGENYASTLTGLNIQPGTNAVVDIDDFVLSSSLTTRTHYEGQYIYTLTTKATGSEVTSEETFEIGYDNVKVYKRDTAYVDNVENVVLAVENFSGFPATNVRVQILADDIDGVLIYDKTFDAIAANDRMTIYLPVEELGSTRLFSTVSTNCTAGMEAEYVELILSNPSTKANLTMEVIGSGTVTPAGENLFDIGETVTIKATPEEGYMFDGWYSNRELTYLSGDEESAQAQIVMPSGDTVITARFVSETPYDFTLSVASAKIYAGDQCQLLANFASLEETGKVVWSSSDPTVATVSSRGVVTGMKEGVAEITATCGEYVHTCQIEVSYVDVTDIRMVYPTLNMAIKETKAVEVLTTPENGNASLYWTSSDESVATVDQLGNVSSVGHGTAIITATAYTNPEVTVQCTVNVILPVTDIALSQYELNLTTANNQAQLEVIYEPTDANYNKQIDWSVDDPDLLELVPSGKYGEKLSITAKKSGTTVITATSEAGYQVSCLVNIRDYVLAETVEQLQSAHYPYETNVERTWIYTDETKDFLILRFSEDTSIHYNDELIIMDGDGNVVASSSDSEIARERIYVNGSTVQIRLRSGNNSSGYYGFRVEEITDAITKDDIHIDTFEQYYTGKALTPDFDVYLFSQQLIAGEDYTLSYSNNKKVGAATVKFTGKGAVEGITTSDTFTILPASSELNATVDSSGIRVSWTASKGAGGYLLYRNVDGLYNGDNEYWTLLKTFSSTSKSYIDKNTDDTHHYSYMLVPYKDVNKVRYESIRAEFGPITRLGPVKNLTGQDDFDHNVITLKWNAVDGAEGYIIYRSVNGYDFYDYVYTTDTQYTVNAYDCCKYQFKIVPYKYINGYLQEGAASSVYTTYRLATPNIRTRVEGKDVPVNYSFTYVEGQTGIQIYRSTNAGKTWKSIKTVKCGDFHPGAYYDNEYIDTSSKTSGTSYQYRARTYVVDGKKSYYSDWSDISSVTYLSTPSISAVKPAENGGLNISWKKVTGAQSYVIDRYFSGINDDDWSQETFTYQVMDPKEKTHVFTDSSARLPGEYFYSIRACAIDPYNSRQYDSLMSMQKPGFILETPAMEDIYNAAKGVTVNWSWSNLANSFEIWRSTNYNAETNTGTWKKIKTVNYNTYLVDTSATGNGTTYTYKVRSYIKSNGVTYYSDFSEPSSIKKMSPPAVKSLKVNDDGGFDLTFSRVKDATGYTVTRILYEGASSITSVELANISEPGQKTYEVSDPGATGKNMFYQYQITAYRNEANGTVSYATSYACGYNYDKPEVTVENAEKGIMVYANVEDRENADYSYASYYSIYRSVNSGSFKLLKTVKANNYGMLIYNDTTAKANSIYSYKVIASGKKFVDAYTAEMSDATDPIRCKPGPKISSLTNVVNGVTIQWAAQKTMPAAAGYAIYRSQNNFDYEQIATVDAEVFTYTDTTVSNDSYYYEDNIYYYKVAVIPADETLPMAFSGAKKIMYLAVPYVTGASYANAVRTAAYVDVRFNGGVQGYEIRYTTGRTKKTVKNTTMLKNLAPGKTYQIDVRTYFKYEGKTYYSAWSNPYSLG